MKWFMRWGVKDLLDLLGKLIKDRLLKALRMKWHNAKMSKLEYDIPPILGINTRTYPIASHCPN